MYTEVPQVLVLQNSPSLTHKILHETPDGIHALYEIMTHYLKLCLQALNCAFIDVVFRVCKIDDKEIIKTMHEILKKIYGKDVVYDVNGSTVNDKKGIDQMLKLYEKLFTLGKTAPDLLPL